jgi:orotidine-5'-phosphate decarboxylase
MADHSPNPVLCALDTKDQDRAEALARALTGTIGGLKVGLEYFSATGPGGMKAISEIGMPVFLDLKLHDIPNTVAHAVEALVPLKPFMMTVHTAGGSAMMRAAADAARETAQKLSIPRPLMVGVTVLTSLDGHDLNQIGVDASPADQVRRLAGLAQASGLDGVVCSPHEIANLRSDCGSSFTLVVPGIRPAGAALGDQKRVMTPRQALDAGASHLVIGRPITEADDPRAAAEAIARELEA